MAYTRLQQFNGLRGIMIDCYFLEWMHVFFFWNLDWHDTWDEARIGQYFNYSRDRFNSICIRSKSTYDDIWNAYANYHYHLGHLNFNSDLKPSRRPQLE